MGYIALEMVEALCARGIGVEMVKPGPVFLPWMDAELAEAVRKEVEAREVKLHLEYAIERIESAEGALHVVGSGGVLAGEMVLIATGVKPNSELAAGAALKLGPHRAIAVDMSLKTSDEAIYAAGDCADAYHVVTGQRVWVPLALRANRAGWAAADNVCGTKTTLLGIAGTAVFKVFDLEVARTGLNAVEATNAGFEPAAVTIQSRSRAHAHPGSATIWVHMVADRRSGKLLGVQMVGKEGVAHRINAPAVALHGKMTVEEFSQSDLAYAPPFGPVWDPLLTAANQLLKELS
jgi:pyruvate/2-oxoglutarate dehydrogenase complex dihydrolipoamide dehydrogenase (E3) component